MNAPLGSRYPSDREADIVLRDGATVHVRPIRADDEDALEGFFRALSPESRQLRFFTGGLNFAREAQSEAQVDYAGRSGLLATTGPDQKIVGHAFYAATEPHTAEVAFAVDDAYQGRGLGTMLLGQLAEMAAANGIERFEALVLPVNHRMLDVFREAGFTLTVRREPDAIRLEFPTLLDQTVLERFDRREQVAAAGALAPVLQPRSIAVIGASREAGTVGAELFRNLLRGEFAGPVYPINPAAAFVQCVTAWPTIEAIGGPVDLAVVAVPAAHVVEVAEQCGRAGVRALVVISAGFAETGPEGRERQEQLLRVCRASGMRLIGPNCIGVLNTNASVRLNAIFGPQTALPGRVSFASQSGALGLAAIDYASRRGLGIASFVSMGNKADISGNDLLNYWESDPNTDVILLYLESFGNPRKFSRIARRVGRQKPIVVVKSGRSAAGSRATSSHTGALLAASDVTVDALFKQAGVIRTDSLDGLFDVAGLLAHQPLPAGRRVGIVTNVGGPAIMCADACEAEGLEVPVLAETTRAALRRLLPAEASVNNPVDMIATATADQYAQAVRLVAADPGIDAIVAIFIPPLSTRAEDVARSLTRAADGGLAMPLLAVFMSSTGQPTELQTPALTIPCYSFPESAAMALARAAAYAEWRRRSGTHAVRPDGVRQHEAAALVSDAVGHASDWLQAPDVARLLSCYGLPLVEQCVVATPAEAGEAAASLGGPLALKAIVPGLIHKTEARAVQLDLQDGDAVREAAQSMAQHLMPTGFLVQRMLPPGVEMLAGVVHDAQFGPVVACGAGGTAVEVLKDVSVRLTPVTPLDAADMVRDLKTFPLLSGFRGSAPCNVAALEDVIVRLSSLADDLPEVAEVDCNPVLVTEAGATIVDARVRVAKAEPARPLGARR
jgi:acetyl coenzyme A synthetase (ADP forming)-like protein